MIVNCEQLRNRVRFQECKLSGTQRDGLPREVHIHTNEKQLGLQQLQGQQQQALKNKFYKNLILIYIINSYLSIIELLNDYN